MSFDLSVWRASATPMTTADAERRYREPGEREAGGTPEPEIAAFLRELTATYPDLAMATLGRTPWTASLEVTETSVTMRAAGEAATEVLTFVQPLAVRHGLVLFDPNNHFVHNPSTPVITMTLANGYAVGDPDPGRLEESVRQLERSKRHLVLDRGGERYVQAMYGGDATKQEPAWYILERREGSARRHYRSFVHEAGGLLPAFRGFADGEPGWTEGYAWERLELR